jgi:predicted ABC-type ATPase
VIIVPVDLTAQRVIERTRAGGHSVPESKIRERFGRLWHLVAEAAVLADEAFFYDNSSAHVPFRLCAAMVGGQMVGDPEWPTWTPPVLIDL